MAYGVCQDAGPPTAVSGIENHWREAPSFALGPVARSASISRGTSMPGCMGNFRCMGLTILAGGKLVRDEQRPLSGPGDTLRAVATSGLTESLAVAAFVLAVCDGSLLHHLE